MHAKHLPRCYNSILTHFHDMLFDSIMMWYFQVGGGVVGGNKSQNSASSTV